MNGESLDERITRVAERISQAAGGLPPTEQYLIRQIIAEEMGELILERVVQVASGEIQTKAELLAQNDFIPWKRGVSL